MITAIVNDSIDSSCNTLFKAHSNSFSVSFVYWLQKHRKLNDATSSGEVDLVKRLAELERENKRLTMERDILKKASAYFEKESL